MRSMTGPWKCWTARRRTGEPAGPETLDRPVSREPRTPGYATSDQGREIDTPCWVRQGECHRQQNATGLSAAGRSEDPSHAGQQTKRQKRAEMVVLRLRQPKQCVTPP